jgi:hypothetical protein
MLDRGKKHGQFQFNLCVSAVSVSVSSTWSFEQCSWPCPQKADVPNGCRGNRQEFLPQFPSGHNVRRFFPTQVAHSHCLVTARGQCKMRGQLGSGFLKWVKCFPQIVTIMLNLLVRILLFVWA